METNFSCKFKIKVEISAQLSPACSVEEDTGLLFTNETGAISLTPQQYEANMTCKWTLSAPSDKVGDQTFQF